MPNIHPYSLSIRIYSDGFSFSVSDGKRVIAKISKQPSKQTQVISDLIQELQKQSLYHTPFNAVDITTYTPVFTIVPTHLFKQEDIQNWLQLVQVNAKFYTDNYTDNIVPFGCSTLYTEQIALCELIKNYNNAIVKHAISALLEDQVVLASAQKETGIFVDITPNEIVFAALKNGKLQIANMLKYNTKEDLLYHILNIYEQLQFSNHQVGCQIKTSDCSADIAELLSQYIEHITETH